MKKYLPFVLGLAVGVVLTVVVYQARNTEESARTTALATASPETAQLRQTVSRQTEQIQRLQGDNAALTDEIAQLKAVALPAAAAAPGASVSTPPPAPAAAAAAASESDTNRTSGMTRMFKAAMQQQVEMKLSALKMRLRLSEEQDQSVREILEKQFAQAGDMVTKMMDGKLSKDEMAKVQQSATTDVDSQIKGVLTPDQWTEYEKYKVEERQTQLQMAVNSELLQVQPMLQLSQQQQQQVFDILYQQYEQFSKPDPAKAPPDWDQLLEAKKNALRPVLTAEQLQNYEKFIESQKAMIKSFMPSAEKPVAPGAGK